MEGNMDKRFRWKELQTRGKDGGEYRREVNIESNKNKRKRRMEIWT